MRGSPVHSIERGIASVQNGQSHTEWPKFVTIESEPQQWDETINRFLTAT